MRLISTRWIDFLHEYQALLEQIKRDLFHTLYEYDLKKITFEVQEGYRGTDTGLQNFPRFLFTYLTCQHNETIEIEVTPGDLPVVKIKDKKQPFTAYFGLNESESNELRTFFYAFGMTLIRT